MQELKDLVALLAQMVKSGVLVAKDGKVDLTDLPAFFAIVQKVPAAFEGLSKVPVELSHLTEEQAAEVVAFAMTELALEEGKAKAVVEHSLKVAAAVGGLVAAIKA